MTTPTNPPSCEAAAIDRMLTLAITHGTAQRQLVESEGRRFLLTHRDYELNELADRPIRPSHVAASVSHETLGSLAAYVNRFRVPGTTLYVSDEARKIEAVIDHHNEGRELEGRVLESEPAIHDNAVPGWRSHRAWHQAKPSERYTAWKAISGKFMGQEDFAHWVEEHLPEIIEPDAARVLEVIETMHASLQGKFRRVIRRDNGTAVFTFDQEIQAAAGKKGELEIPGKLLVSVECYEGGPRYKLPVNLRYRLNQQTGGVSWGVQIYGQSDFERKAWGELVEAFQNAIEAPTEVRMYRGTLLEG